MDWIKNYKKKIFNSMQNLRDLKFKNYPFWRIDKRHLQIIDGGGTFLISNTKSNFKKIKSFSHGEFNDSDLSEENIEKKLIKMKIFLTEVLNLKKIKLDETFPEYILNNKKKYLKWIS